MEHLRCVLISLAGYEHGTLSGHVIITDTPQDAERTSVTVDIEIPAVGATEDGLLWARRVLSAALAEL